MIVYDGLKSDFLASCERDSIAMEIEEKILSKMGRHTPKAFFRKCLKMRAFYATMIDASADLGNHEEVV